MFVLKINGSIWYRSWKCLQLQRSNVSCSSVSGLHTLQQEFWPSSPHRSSLYLSSFRAVTKQHWVSAPFKDFLLDLGLETGKATPELLDASYRVTRWFSLLCASCYYHVGRPSDDSSSTLWLREGGRCSKSLYTWSCPLCRKTARSIHLSLPTLNGIMIIKFSFGLIWPHDFLQCLLCHSSSEYSVSHNGNDENFWPIHNLKVRTSKIAGCSNNSWAHCINLPDQCFFHLSSEICFF